MSGNNSGNGNGHGGDNNGNHNGGENNGNNSNSGSGNNDNNAYSSWSQSSSRSGEANDGEYLTDSSSANYGLDVNFQYSHGEGEDGFSFLVLDASGSDQSGHEESILGIEFTRQVTGNGEGRNSSQDVISLRGPGDGTSNAYTSSEKANYALIATTANLDGNSFQVDSGWSQVQQKHNGDLQDTEVVVDTTQLGDGKLPVTVLMNNEKGNQVVVAQYDAYREVKEYYGSAENIPQSMRIGFSGSTGGGTTYTTNSSFALADPGASTPEPSTLMLGIGGLLLAGAVGWRRAAAICSSSPTGGATGSRSSTGIATVSRSGPNGWKKVRTRCRLATAIQPTATGGTKSPRSS